MYLARSETGTSGYSYILRESCECGGVMCARDLYDLGTDPSQVIVYASESSFYFEEHFLSDISKKATKFVYEDLEELFLPFLDPYLRNRLEPFRHRSQYRNWKPVGKSFLERALKEIHPLDQRRVHFLRLGRTSTETVEKTAAMYTPLLDKSRDEIEQLILVQEHQLAPREYQQYLFAIFDLQRFFKESYARSIPQALNRDRLDTLFLQEICRLAADHDFWLGYPVVQGLPRYLVRYLIMYFDEAPEETISFTPFQRRSRRQRFYRPSPSDPGKIKRSQAMQIFGLQAQELGGMQKKDLTRLYRRKALTLHPDRGGDPERFIQLTAAYEALLVSLP